MSTLSTATVIGNYRIDSLIGSGGMGEVYRAMDLRLNRPVAIKITNRRFSERFEREARAISALNHPHICTLYDVGTHGENAYLVMEYVDGKLLEGPIPLARMLKYATQICAALDAAHQKGIVHRDLKPANILATRSGVKLLDFGLAKTQNSIVNAAADPTEKETAVLTGENVVVGTAPYMSPEQIDGRPADCRTDIFALGCVLYELITGKRAFDGKTPSGTMAAVLTSEPRPIADFHITVPPPVEKVIRRCLAKDPEERWQSAKDVAAALDIAAQQPQGASKLPWHHWVSVPTIIAATVVAGAVIFAAFSWGTRTLGTTSTVRFEIFPGDGIQVDGVSVSPDGRMIAFAGVKHLQRQLYIRPLDSLTARAVPGTSGASHPFWSPDGRLVGFFAGTGGRSLKKVSVTSGGPPEVLCEPCGATGAYWHSNGTIIFSAAEKGIHTIPANGGTPTPITSVDRQNGELSHTWPQLLPDGRKFLYFVRTVDAEKVGIYLGSIGTKERKRVVSTYSNAVYSPTGYLLFMRDETLVAQRFDAVSGKLQGEAVPVGTGLAPLSGGYRAFSVSDSGVLVLRTGDGPRKREIVAFDRLGRQVSTIVAGDMIRRFAPSPDSSRIAIEREDIRTRWFDIWVREPDAALTRLTFHPRNETYPLWSPDGSRLVYTGFRDDAPSGDLFWRHADGSGEEQALLRTPEQKLATDWSRDGRFVIYETLSSSGTRWDLWVLPTDGGQQPFAFLRTSFQEIDAHFQPVQAGISKWIAYTSDETGRMEVYVRRFSGRAESPGGSAKWRVSNGGGEQPRWRADGLELYYTKPDLTIVAVEVHPGHMFAAGRVEELFRRPPGHMVVAGDTKFMVARPVEYGQATPVTIVLNWLDGMNQ